VTEIRLELPEAALVQGDPEETGVAAIRLELPEAGQVQKDPEETGVAVIRLELPEAGQSLLVRMAPRLRPCRKNR
jgi:hypothetical protein